MALSRARPLLHQPDRLRAYVHRSKDCGRGGRSRLDRYCPWRSGPLILYRYKEIHMSDMYGKGILKGLGVSLKRFAETYLDDLSWIGKRYHTEGGIAHRSSKDARGIFTV